MDFSSGLDIVFDNNSDPDNTVSSAPLGGCKAWQSPLSNMRATSAPSRAERMQRILQPLPLLEASLCFVLLSAGHVRAPLLLPSPQGQYDDLGVLPH